MEVTPEMRKAVGLPSKAEMRAVSMAVQLGKLAGFCVRIMFISLLVFLLSTSFGVQLNLGQSISLVLIVALLKTV